MIILFIIIYTIIGLVLTGYIFKDFYENNNPNNNNRDEWLLVMPAIITILWLPFIVHAIFIKIFKM